MLRLYRVPYLDPVNPDLVRLLFEGAASIESADRGRLNLYMYVWIDRDRQVRGFQLVLDEELTVTYKAPSILTFGKIGRHPINRTIEKSEVPETKEIPARAAEGMSNREFPELIEWIARVVRGEIKPNRHRLNSRESRELTILTSERP